MESFTYTANGQLATTSFTDNDTYNAMPFNPVFTQTTSYLGAVDTRDAMGRVTAYIEYGLGTGVAFSSTSTYNADSQETSETDNTAGSNGTTTTVTTYDYDLAVNGAYTGAYEGGQVVHSQVSTSLNGTLQAISSARSRTHTTFSTPHHLNNCP